MKQFFYKDALLDEDSTVSLELERVRLDSFTLPRGFEVEFFRLGEDERNAASGCH